MTPPGTSVLPAGTRRAPPPSWRCGHRDGVPLASLTNLSFGLRGGCLRRFGIRSGPEAAPRGKGIGEQRSTELIVAGAHASGVGRPGERVNDVPPVKLATLEEPFPVGTNVGIPVLQHPGLPLPR